MRKMSKDTRRCDQCNTLYEKGFFGTGYRYCSQVCRDEKRNEYHRLRYRKLHKKTSINCDVCGRDIGKVGKSKNISKYCSPKCMWVGTRVRQRGQKYCYVRIPVTVQKLVKIPVEDIPLILKRGVPKLAGK